MSTGIDSSGLTASERERLQQLLASEGDKGIGVSSRIRPRVGLEPAPLSNAQERLWLLHQLEPDNPRYNLFTGFRLDGTLSVSALRRSLGSIVARHHVLRTSFVMADGRARQVIGEATRVDMPEVDLSEIAANEQESRLRCLARTEIDRPFDLTSGALIRPRLFRLAPTRHVFLVAMHHIVTDGWSMGLFLNELAEFYEAERTGRPHALPPLVIQYADFAVWQRNRLRERGLHEQFAYWKRQLADAPVTSRIAVDFSSTSDPCSHAGCEFFRFSPELTAALRRMAEREGVTLFILVLAALKILLHRYTGETDIVVGTGIANRNRSELEHLIGFFVNTLVLRTSLRADLTVTKAIERVREVALDAYSNQDVPFDALVDELNLPREAGRTPLFQLMYVWQTFSHDAKVLPGLAIDKLRLGTESTAFDLLLSVWDSGAVLRAELLYRTDLFAQTTGARLLRCLERLLESFVEEPGQRIGEIAMVTDDDQHALAVWNSTATDRDWEPVQALFTRSAALRPDAVAVDSGRECVTYGMLNRRANQLAHRLTGLSVGPDVRVAVLMERGVELIIALLAALKAGGAYVPLDPDYPDARIHQMLHSASVSLLLTTGKLRHRLPPILKAHVICLEEVTAREDSGQDDPPVTTSMMNAAYVIYTSGSTGQPKGVVVTHAGLTNYLLWSMSVYGAGRFASPMHSSIGFDLTVTSLYLPLLTGGRVVLIGERDGVETALSLQSVLPSVDLVKLTPAHLELLSPQEGRPQRATFVIGGEALSYPQLAKWRDSSSRLRFINEYGPTETVVGCCVYEVGADDLGGGQVPIGLPISNTVVYILDRQMQLAPIGAAGELYVGGKGVARGYLRQPALTAERFVPDAWSGIEGGRLYRTGDRARWRADGQLEYLGRLDNQVKIHGYRIELGEIEIVLREQPGVAQAAVVVRRTPRGEAQLAAYAVPGPGARLEPDALRASLQRRLPGYMIPALLVILPSLPLTENGKVDRNSLPSLEPGAQTEISDTTPMRPMEKILAEVWADVLQVPHVERHSNFFELGGDSILSMQIVARAKARNVQFSPWQLFHHQTVAELACVAEWSGAAATEQTPVTGDVPLTPVQRWFFERPLRSPHHFNQSALFEVPGLLDPRLIERAIAYLVQHHDALRSRFKLTGGEWQQWQLECEDHPVFTHIDLSCLPLAYQDDAWPCAARSLQSSLHLVTGPIARVVYVTRRPARRDLLFIVIHHLVVDGVSWRILLDDLKQVYGQLSNAELPALPPRTTSLKSWSGAMQQFAKSEALHAERHFWFSGERRDIPPLFRDASAGANTIASCDHVSFELDEAHTRNLIQDAPRRFRARITELLLTAAEEALMVWCEADRLLVDVEGHGREPVVAGVDLSRTIGWFTNIYPVVLHRAAGVSIPDKLRAMKEQLRQIGHGGIGYGALRYLSNNSAAFEWPRAEVSFNYLGQFDALLSDGVLVPSAEYSGHGEDPDTIRPYLLEITAWIAQGRFRASCRYSTNIHERGSIGHMFDRFHEVIRGFARDSASTPSAPPSAADFPLAGLSKEGLDAVLNSIRTKRPI